jgi:hypothetical protein
VRLGGPGARTVVQPSSRFSNAPLAGKRRIEMNDDDPARELELMRAEHRLLDEQIRDLIERGCGDQIELARLKKRKLRLKDHIQIMMDSAVPDITA